MSAAKKIKKGISLYQEKKYQQAVNIFREALAIEPHSAEANYRMGLLASIGGEAATAKHFLDLAIAYAPQNAEYVFDKGRLHEILGETNTALECYYKVVQLAPDNDAYCQNLINIVRKLRFLSPNPELLVTLNALMARPNIDGSAAMYAWTSLYLLSPQFALLQQDASSDTPIAKCASLHDPLLINAMAYNSIQDPQLEEALVSIRRKLAQSPLNENLALFLTAMSLQCFLNEYLWDVTPEEEKRVAELKAKAEKGDAKLEDLLLLASYLPLYLLKNIHSYEDMLSVNELSALIWKRQVAEPLREITLREQIPCLTPIEDDISAKVQAQYEENPYPRWDELNIYPRMSFKAYLTNIMPFISKERFSAVNDHSKVLIAGVGTGRQVLGNANIFPKFEFEAVDLSMTSLAYAARKKQELFPNAKINFAQADILRLEEAFPAESFEIIECCGVLHHMDDPMAGWKVLTRLLKKKGFMKIALYSKTARIAITAIREKINAENYPSTVEGIRAMRKFVKAGAASDPELNHLCHSPDFYSTSACRDLLFHVQEHQFTLPQIKEAIKELGLEFLGIDLHDAKANAELREMFSLSMASVPTIEQWEKFEEKHTGAFGGMYQFWLQKE